MKKRLAIQFYGHLRTYEQTYQSLFNCIVKPNEKEDWQVDFFIHTYDSFEHHTKVWHDDNQGLKNRIVTAEDKARIIQIFKPKALKIEHLKEHENGLFRSVEAGNTLREAYENEQDFKYDLIFYTRADIFYNTPLCINTYLKIYQNHPKFGDKVLKEDFHFICHGQFIRMPVSDMDYLMECLCWFSNFSSREISIETRAKKILIDYVFMRDFFMQREHFIYGFGSNISQKYALLSEDFNILKEQIKTLNLALKPYLEKKGFEKVKTLLDKSLAISQKDHFALRAELARNLGKELIYFKKNILGFLKLIIHLSKLIKAYPYALRKDEEGFKFYAHSQPFRYFLDFNLGSAFLNKLLSFFSLQNREGGGLLFKIYFCLILFQREAKFITRDFYKRKSK